MDQVVERESGGGVREGRRSWIVNVVLENEKRRRERAEKFKQDENNSMWVGGPLENFRAFSQNFGDGEHGIIFFFLFLYTQEMGRGMSCFICLQKGRGGGRFVILVVANWNKSLHQVVIALI